MTEVERSCPYPGLRPFRAVETDIFFGRETLVTELLRKLGEHRFLAVVGTSGCGKSSLVRTGLIGALETGLLAATGARWRIADMRPGGDPMGRLAEALGRKSALGAERGAEIDPQLAASLLRADLQRGPLALEEMLEDAPLPPETNLLILVDQFEEIFRYRKEGRISDADAFVSLLLGSARSAKVPVYVVITMRSDFLGDCALFEELPAALNRGQFLVPRLTREQRRAAIERPAQVFGANVESGLVNRLLNDMEIMRLQAERNPEAGPVPDQLPLMQHVLMRVWQRVEVRSQDGAIPNMLLTMDDYHAAGGLANALSIHADEALAALTDPELMRVAQVMLRMLTERGQDRRDVRRPTRMGKVCAAARADAEQVRRVVEVFRHPDRSFLMPPAGTELHDDTFLDISHESLISQWKTLDQWADEEAAAADVYRELLRRARLWEDEQEEPLRRTGLRRARQWKSDRAHNAAWAEQYGGDYELVTRFIGQSERRALIRYSGAGAAVLLFVGVVGTIAFIRLDAAAMQRKADAEKAKIQHTALVQAGRYELKSGPSGRALALLLGVEAHEMARTPQSRELLADALGKDLILTNLPAFGRPRVGHSEAVRSMAIDQSGTRVVSVGDDARSIVWSLSRREAHAGQPKALGPLRGKPVQLSARGDVVAIGLTGGGFELWSTETGESVGRAAQVRGHTDILTSVALSPDARLIATGSRDNTVFVWERETGKQILGPLQGHRGDVTRVAFSPDHRALASASADGTVILWDVASGKPLGDPLSAHRGGVNTFAFSSDGKLLATGGNDSAVALWDVAGGRRRGEPMRGHRQGVTSVAFSEDGRTLASGSRDNTVLLWNVSTGKQRGEPLREHTGDITSLAFARDGRSLATGGKDRQVIIWDVQGDQVLRRLRHSLPVDGVVFSRRHRRVLASIDSGRTVRLWDWINGRPLTTSDLLGGRASSLGAARSNPLLAAARASSLLAAARSSTMLAVARSSTFLAAANDHRVVVFDMMGARLEPQGIALEARAPQATAITLSGDGRMVATGTKSGMVMLWDADARKLLHQLAGDGGEVQSLAFDPTGQLLASGDSGGFVRIWETEGGKERRASAPTRKGGLHKGRVKTLAFSPDGRTLASGGADDRVVLWDIEKDVLKGDVSDTDKTHLRDVLAVAFSPDGLFLVSGSQDNTIRLWDVATGVPLGAPLTGHGRSVTNVVYHPRNGTLLSAGSGGKIIVWKPAVDEASVADLKYAAVSAQVAGPSSSAPERRQAQNLDQELRGTQPGRIATMDGLPLAAHPGSAAMVVFDPNGRDVVIATEDRVLRQRLSSSSQAEHSRPAFGIAFSPDGKWLASSGLDGSIIMRDRLDHGAAKFDLPRSAPETVANYGLAFSPDGKSIAWGTQDKRVVIWDVESRKPRFAPLEGHSQRVMSVAFSPNGKLVASAASDRTIRLWDTLSGQPVGEPLPLRGSAWDVAFDPRGDVLAVAGDDRKVTLWDVASGAMLRELVGHSSGVRSIAFAASGMLLASASLDKTVRIWDVDTGEVRAVLQHEQTVYSVAVRSDGRFVASGDSKGAVFLWDAHTHLLAARLDFPQRGGVFGLAFSPDGQTLASTGSRQNAVHIADQKLIESLQRAQALAHAEARRLALSLDGKHVLAVHAETDVIVLDTENGTPAFGPAAGHSAPVRVAEFSPDGRLVATGDEKGSVLIWNVSTGKRTGRSLSESTEPVTALAFAADSVTLAIGHDNGVVYTWNVAQGSVKLGLPTAKNTAVTSLAFSPSARLLATGGADSVIRVFDLQSETIQARVLREHGNWVSSLKFLDESTLVSGGLDSVALIWDLPSRSRIAKLTGHKDAVVSMAISRDRKRLATSGLDGSILIWAVDAESWVARACKAAGRVLYNHEKASFLQKADYADRCTRVLASGDR